MTKIKLWLRSHPISLASVSAAASLFFIAVANAQDSAPPPTVENKGELTNLICNFIVYFFWVIIIISVIFVLVAAFDYVTAGDDTEKTTRARKRLTYAAVGVAVALLATGFPAIVSSVFPQNPNATLGDACTVF